MHGLWQEAVDLCDQSRSQVRLHTPIVASIRAAMQSGVGSVQTAHAHWRVTEHAIVRLLAGLVLRSQERGAVPVGLAVVCCSI